MGRKPVSRPAEFYGPPAQEVVLYWIDERVRTPVRRKIHPIHGRGPSQVSVPRGTIFSPGVARMESRDIDKLIAWVQARLHEGWINESDLQERQDLMRRLIRKQRAQQFAAPDPAATAGIKKSGKSEKPRRKPIMDRQMPASVRNNGTVVGHKIKGVFGS